MKTVSASWLEKQNILIDDSMEEFYTLYQHHLATELICRLQNPSLQDLLQQPVALKKKDQGGYWLANNFGLLLLINNQVLTNSHKLLRVWQKREFEVISWREIKHQKINLIIETLNILAVISRNRSNLCHAEIYKILKKQLNKDEWLSFYGKNRFLIADYLEQVGISKSTFDRSRGRVL